MALTESKGRWARAVAVRLPKNAVANPAAVLNSVSCTSAGSCVAVGYFASTSGHGEAMTATQAKGLWARAVQLRPAAGAAANPEAELNSVACAGTGTCVAVGSYLSPSGLQPMIVTETGGRWTRATRSRVPSGAAAAPDAFLTSVTCTGARTCVAVGAYSGQGSLRLAMRVAESKGRWARAHQVGQPSNALTGARRFAVLYSVACGQHKSCAAVGLYYQTATIRQAMAAAIPVP